MLQGAKVGVYIEWEGVENALYILVL